MSKVQTANGYAVGVDSGEAVWFNGGLVLLKATGSHTAGTFGAIELRARKGFGSPLHVHERDDEIFVVLEGDVRFQLGEAVTEATTGSLVYGPREVGHAFRVDSPEARLLLIFGPAGTEGFFREAGKPAPSVQLPPLDEVFLDKDALMEIAGRYHQRFVGPPLPPRS
jgi:quercetin dioxygenase-like cupin family protein